MDTSIAPCSRRPQSPSPSRFQRLLPPRFRTSMSWSTNTVWGSPRMQPKNLSDHSVLDKSVLAPAAQPASVLDDSVSADAVLKDSVLKEDFALKGRGFKPRRKYRKIDRGFSRCGRILAATRMQPWLLVWVLGANLGQVCAAQDIHAPTSVPAGEDTHFITTGSDKATFYLVGPGVSSKSDVELARGVRIPAQSVRNSGILQANAALNGLTSRHAVQQVASEPCNLRSNGQRTSNRIVVETEPVRYCSGTPVPDGTIVTFTASSENTKSSVDAPVKR